MSKVFHVPRNPDEVMQWINSIPRYKEELPEDLTFKSKEEVLDVQNSNLRNQMERLEKFSPYYRKKFNEWRIDPKSIKTVDDLEKIPLTTKAEFMADMGESFKLEMDMNNVMEYILYEVTYTTGTTTGMPSRFYNTTYDMFAISWAFRIGGKTCYYEPDDIVMNLFPFHFVPHIGFYRSWHFPAAIGMGVTFGFTGSPLPGFPHNIHRSMQQAIEDIEKKKVTLISGIGSYIRRLIMAAEEQGRDFSSVNKVQALGEPCPKGMRDDIRRRLQNMGAGEVFVGNSFGFTECQVAFPECAELGGCHSVPELFFLEAVDEKTGKRKPDGEPGLLTITHLDKRGTCLLRYLVGDIVAITHETCPHCGRNGARLVTIGGSSTYGTRTKELLKVKGTLINPVAMCDAVANTEGVLEYQFVVTKEKPDDPYSMDLLKLRLGVEEGVDRKKLEASVIDKVQRAVELRPKVEFVEDLSEIYNTDNLKATRVMDERPKE